MDSNDRKNILKLVQYLSAGMSERAALAMLYREVGPQLTLAVSSYLDAARSIMEASRALPALTGSETLGEIIPGLASGSGANLQGPLGLARANVKFTVELETPTGGRAYRIVQIHLPWDSTWKQVMDSLGSFFDESYKYESWGFLGVVWSDTFIR